KGPNWLFDIDYLTDSMNYQPVTTENKANKTAGPKEANHSAVKSSEAKNGDVKPNGDTSPKTNEESKDQEDQAFLEELERLKRQENEANDAAEVFSANSTNTINTVSTPISIVIPSNVFSVGGPDLNNNDQDDFQIPSLEDIYDNPSDGIFTDASYDDEGAVVDFTNLETTVNVSPIPTSRIHSIHPTTQIHGDTTLAVQIRSKGDAMQEELLQFKIQKVWILVDLPFGKRAIGTKWVYRNKKDERGVIVRNKVRLVAQGYRQEEGIDYDEVFALMARIEDIMIFLAFASYMGFIVYQMDMKSSFLYGTINEEVYVSQPPGFVDPKFPKKSGYRRGTIEKTLFIKKDKNDIMLVQVYVDDIIFGSTKRSWCDEFEALMKSRFQMSYMGELTFFLGLQVKQKVYGIFISQDKYVAKILKKFDFTSVKTASTPIETQKPFTKDEEAADVDVHLYRSMIGSLMYLTAFRPDIMFASVIIYLEAYSDSNYAGANLDKKSTTGGCQFLGRRLISWQYKKQTIVATSTTEAEYVAAANCCGQNLVFHSKTKHIEIRHHFIRDAYEKKLIQVLKIHTDDNVADLLTKAFDVNTGSPKLSTARPKLNTGRTKLSTARPKLSTDSTKIESMKLEAMVEERRIFKCWFHYHTTNGHQFTMSNRHQELASPEQTAPALAIPEQTATGKEISNPFMADAKEFQVYSVTKEFKFIKEQIKEKVTPLFATMLVQPTEDEGAPSERPSEAQPTPSPAPTSEVPNEPQTDSSPAHTSEVPIEQQTDPSPRPSPSTIIPDSIPETSGGNLGDQVLNQISKEILHMKAQIKKLKKQAKPVIKHHRAWLQSVSFKQKLARKSSSKKQRVHKESVSKQGRKFAKGEPSVQRDPLFDEIPEDTVDHMETENAQDVGRIREIVDEEKENDENIVSTEDVLSTDKEKVSTAKEKVSSDRPIVSTDRQIEGTDEQIESTDEQRKGTEDHTKEGSATQATQTPTSTIFGDDETIAKVLLNMSQAKAVSREKEKGPLPPKIDPKDKGKEKIERKMNLKVNDWYSMNAEKKFKQLESDERWLGKCKKSRKARIKADRLLAEKLQEQEREQFTIEERAKGMESLQDRCWFGCEAISETSLKGVHEESLFKTCCMYGGRLIQLIIYNVLYKKKTNEDPKLEYTFHDKEKSEDIFSFGRLWLIVIVLDRNIVEFFEGWKPLSPLQLAVEEVMSE
ncbi:putative ribonuclease H-like domain-containing protein, partial [Tanacetum coccineum]